MKKLFILIALAAFVLVPSSEAQQKLGFIDMQKVFRNFSKTKDSDHQLKLRADEIQAERSKMVDKFSALERQFKTIKEETEGAALSMEAKAQKRNEAEELLVEMRRQKEKIQEYQRQRKKELEDISLRMRGDLVDEINDVLEEYSLDNGYTVIFDISGESYNRLPIAVYRDPKFDVTDDIIAIINEPEGE